MLLNHRPTVSTVLNLNSCQPLRLLCCTLTTCHLRPNWANHHRLVQNPSSRVLYTTPAYHHYRLSLQLII